MPRMNVLCYWLLMILLINSAFAQEDCSTAIIINGPMPQSLQGNTCSYQDDYDWSCPVESQSPDIVYSYSPTYDQTISFDMCTSMYDTKLIIYQNDCDSDPIACSDYSPGYCGDETQAYVQGLMFYGGSTYYIVVDGGYSMQCGDYTLNITELPERACQSCTPVNADLGSITQTACGDSISGSLGWGGKWIASFSGEEGATYFWDLCPAGTCPGHDGFGDTTDPDFVILDESCNILTSVDGQESCGYRPDEWSWICPSTGTYYIAVCAFPAITEDTLTCYGNSDLTFTMYYYALPSRDCSSCTPVNADLGDIAVPDCGGVISGNCGWSGKWVASFVGHQDVIYHWDLCADEPCGGNCEFDADVVILDASCIILEWYDGEESCGYRPNDYQWLCPADGNYYVAVAPYPSVDADTLTCGGNNEQIFTLIYSAMPDQPCASCTAVNADLGDITTAACGASVSGDCGWSGKWLARFTGFAGVTYHWDLCALEPCGGVSEFDGTDPDIVILDAACSIIEWHDGSDECGYQPNDYQWICPAYGDYYVMVAPNPALQEDTLTCLGNADQTFTMVFWREEGIIPGGEVCATAAAISGPFPKTVTGNTCSYVNDYDVECWQSTDPGGRDAVYKYSPVADEFVTLNLCDAAYDTKLYVFADNCSGTPWACSNNDISGVCPDESRSYLPCIELLAGHTYYIIIDAVNEWECGDFTLEIASCTPIEGDVIQTAWIIPSLPFSGTGLTAGMQDQYVEDCGGYSYSRDVVYAYSPPNSVLVEIDLAMSQFPTRLYVYENSRSNLFACDNDGAPGRRAFITGLTLYAGNTYYIVVEGDEQFSGEYRIDILEPSLGRCCMNDGGCADNVSSRQCSYHLGHGVWTEGANCGSACPEPPVTAAPIDSAVVPVNNGCYYGITFASNCRGELFYDNTCMDSLYTTNKDGELLGAVQVTYNGWPTWFETGCWDGTRELLWATRDKTVCLLDPATGIMTSQFSVPLTCFDMDFDPADNTLRLQEFEGSLIYHYSTDGTLLDYVIPLDTNGHADGYLRGVCHGVDNMMYVSHSDGRITRHDKTTGEWLGLFAENYAWGPRALACDAASYAPVTVLWWKFDTTYYAYTVPDGTCECPECLPPDSMTVRLSAGHDHIIVDFYAPENGTYIVHSTTDMSSVFPTGFAPIESLSCTAGRNSWTDPSTLDEYRRYVVVHSCDSEIMQPPITSSNAKVTANKKPGVISDNE